MLAGEREEFKYFLIFFCFEFLSISLTLEKKKSFEKKNTKQPIHACGDCFKVTGPSDARVESFSKAPGSNSTYHVSLAWDKGYSGPVVLDAEQAR